MDVDFVLTAIVIAIAVWFFGVEPTIRFFWRIGTRVANAITIMSSRSVREWVQLGDEPVHVPVPGSQYQTPVPDDFLDTRAEKPISRHMSDGDIITHLSLIRTPEGALRFSANAIAELVGGRRADVLAQVRELRNGIPTQEARYLNDDGSTSPATYPISGRRNGDNRP